jgi:ribosomal protein S27E
MKILKYGDGYPKTVVCEHCGSELEYETNDVYSYYKTNYLNDNKIVFSEQHKTLDCPVCKYAIDLETLLIQYPVLVEPEVKTQPKKGWWQK